MLKRYKFYRLHIPTEQQSSDSIEAHSYAHFHAMLDRWNATAPGTWQYWSAPDAPQV